MDIQRRAEGVAARGVFLGGPVRKFSEVGRMQLSLLVHYGLKPHHRVLDIGAGALRAGVWLMDYLDPGNYYAIEPNKEMVEAGLEIARPSVTVNISHNDRYDFTVFDTEFDYGLARSIWTHAPLAHVDRMLASWQQVGDLLFASYRRAWVSGYQGNEWVGISHQSTRPGMVRHRLSDLRRIAHLHHLNVEPVRGWRAGGQRWLKVYPTCAS